MSRTVRRPGLCASVEQESFKTAKACPFRSPILYPFDRVRQKNHQIPVASPYYLTTFRQNIKFNYFISIFRNSKCSADWIPSHRRPSAGYSQNLPLQFCIMLSFWLQNVNKLTMFTNRNHQFLCNQHRNWFEILWKSPLSFFENQLYAPPNL